MVDRPVATVIFSIGILLTAAGVWLLAAPLWPQWRAPLASAAAGLGTALAARLGSGPTCAMTATRTSAERTVASDAGPPPGRLTRDDQWSRTTRVITESIARVDEVQALQRGAEQQLDAATYALQRLFAELSGVVRAPLGSAIGTDGAPEAAVVHQLLVPAARREPGEAIAA